MYLLFSCCRHEVSANFDVALLQCNEQGPCRVLHGQHGREVSGELCVFCRGAESWTLCSQGDNKGFLVCKKKMATSADLLCRYTPPAFRQFTEAVVNLKFDEEPRYSAYVPLFEPLCGPGPQRPILLEEKSRVGQKRGREAFEGEDVDIVSLLSPLQCSRTLHAFMRECAAGHDLG